MVLFRFAAAAAFLMFFRAADFCFCVAIDGRPVQKFHSSHATALNPACDAWECLQLDLLRGTLAPFLRASERPIAIACFLLFTRPPLPLFPERSVPFFLRCIALLTDLLAALPYLAIAGSPFCVVLNREPRRPNVYAAHNTIVTSEDSGCGQDFTL